MTRSLLLLLSAIVALSLASASASSRASTLSGTAVATKQQGSATLVSLRAGNGKISVLTLTRTARVTTADGHAIPAADIRSGDHLTVRGGSQVQDMSQKLESVRGIISVAPLDKDDPIVLQITSSLMIAIDTDAASRYTDSSRETSSIGQLQDADILQVHGIYDSVLGEMTRTDSIARLGPSHQKKHSTGKKP